MPTRNNITTGVNLWTDKDHKTTCWLELGIKKANAVCDFQQLSMTFLFKIPPPFGPIIAAAVVSRHAVFCSHIGPNGTWVKFDVTGPIRSRKRTAQNKLKAPAP